MHAIVSIHDLSPETIDKVSKIIDTLPEAAKASLVLLVIPGRNWTPEQIDKLRVWQNAGIELAGHGWKHKADKIVTLYHKLHSLFISRDVAEHLSLNSSQIADLMRRNRQWFYENKLQPPECYVPPAWALGRISQHELQQTGYRYIEDTAGYYNTASGKRKNLTLVGFEADTSLRQMALIFWNAVNRMMSSKNRPLRISIHPHDPELKLAAAIGKTINRVDTFMTYREIFDEQG